MSKNAIGWTGRIVTSMVLTLGVAGGCDLSINVDGLDGEGETDGEEGGMEDWGDEGYEEGGTGGPVEPCEEHFEACLNETDGSRGLRRNPRRLLR